MRSVRLGFLPLLALFFLVSICQSQQGGGRWTEGNGWWNDGIGCVNPVYSWDLLTGRIDTHCEIYWLTPMPNGPYYDGHVGIGWTITTPSVPVGAEGDGLEVIYAGDMVEYWQGKLLFPVVDEIDGLTRIRQYAENGKLEREVWVGFKHAVYDGQAYGIALSAEMQLPADSRQGYNRLRDNSN